ncbi:MAG TPA: FAD-binding oxidoreductase [Burkholderiales bacterium]|nr:FAD-binding oxidoreductase [Burkholderiales bacterium]
MSLDSAVKDLAPKFTGRLLQVGDAGYDEARRVHNGLVDKRPALVARCHGVADVADAVKLARSQGLQVSVRGGGHNVAGRASIDHGVMIDLSPMRGIHVDPKKQTARAQGGVLWNAFNRETQLHGLATTGGVVGSTGLAGLTLGGGLGWLMPKYGLALDNLLAAEMVLADGSVKRASPDENPDLFWGIRGGGSNFGIAASLEYRLHPVGPIITGGLVAHPLARGVDTLKFFRDRCAMAPDDAMLAAGLLTAPDGSMKIAGILLAHCGSFADGEALATPIKAFGPPAVDHMGPLPYTVQNSLLDAAFPKGALNYWKAQFLTDLSDDCIKTLVECAAACPSPMSQIVLEHFHGKASRIGVTETACAMRLNGFNAVIASQWQDPSDTERNIKWCRNTFGALQPYFGATRYVNYLADDESGDSAAVAAYGPNYARLREIKSKYDPENFFRINVNVKPA